MISSKKVLDSDKAKAKFCVVTVASMIQQLCNQFQMSECNNIVSLCFILKLIARFVQGTKTINRKANLKIEQMNITNLKSLILSFKGRYADTQLNL